MMLKLLPATVAAIFGTTTFAAAAPDLANPASALCAKNGGQVEMEPGANGGQRGICVFPDGTRIDEWTYFRNKHRTQK